MRALIIVVLFARVAQADEAGTCVMTCTDPQHCSSGCGSPSSSSDSGGDAEMQAAFAAEREKLREIDEDNLRRENARKRVVQVRSYTHDGISAYKQKQWRKAIEAFDRALRRDPDNAVLKADLAAAEHALAEESAMRQAELVEKQRKREAAARAVALDQLRKSYAAEQRALSKRLLMKPVPPPDPSAFSHAVDERLPDPPAEILDATTAMNAIYDLSTARAKNDLFDEAKGTLDTMTGAGLFVAVHVNEASLWTDTLPGVLMSAVRNELSLSEAQRIDLKFATILFNVGATPGALGQRLVEVGSAGVVAVDETSKLLHETVEHGIVALTGAAGERTLQAAHAAEDFQRWLQPHDEAR